MNLGKDESTILYHTNDIDAIRIYLQRCILLEPYENTTMANMYGILTAAMDDPEFPKKHDAIKYKLLGKTLKELQEGIAKCIVERKPFSTIING